MLHGPNRITVPVSPKSRSVWTYTASSMALALAVLASAPAQQSNGGQEKTAMKTTTVAQPAAASPTVAAQAAPDPADDSAELLLLAVELKKDMAKTSKDMLSVDVIRKALDIEHVAHDAEYKTRLTLAAR